MARCEDFPCCGHQLNECPDLDSKGREVWRCSEGCGRKLPRSATSSICKMCMKRLERLWSEGDDFDYSMNY